MSTTPSFRIGVFTPEILKRDPRLWLMALIRYVWIPLVLAFLTAGAIWIWAKLSPVYTARATLIRTESKELFVEKGNEYYKPMPIKVLVNMIRTRQNLEMVAERLKMPLSPGAIYKMLEIETADRNATSNIISIAATADDPVLAASVANLLAEAFVENYRQSLRRTLKSYHNSSMKGREQLEAELKTLQDKRQTLLNEVEAVSFEDELARRITQKGDLEQRLLLAKSQIESCRIQIANLDSELAVTDSKVVTYSEVDKSDENKLEALQIDLVSLRQRYTDENPQVQAVLNEIENLKVHIKSKEGVKSGKVIYGDSMSYRLLYDARVKVNNELCGAENLVRACVDNLKAAQERIDKLAGREKDYKNLCDDIESKRSILNNLIGAERLMDLSLQTDFSDVAVFEPASAPAAPDGGKGSFIALAAGMFVLFIGVLVIGVSELLNFKVRSFADLTMPFKMNGLCALPVFSQEARGIYYTQLQTGSMTLLPLMESKEKPFVIAYNPLEKEDPFRMDQMVEIFELKGKNVARIICSEVVPDGLSDVLLNNWLYGIDDVLPVSRSGRFALFLDEMIFFSPFDHMQLERLHRALSRYDLVIWELPPYRVAPQFVTTVNEASSLSVISTVFNQTSKLGISELFIRLEHLGAKRFYGILSDIDEKIYRWVV